MTKKATYTGWYARVEGPDGAGKSLLLANAKAYAEKHNIPAIFIREPGTGAFGEEIRNFLLHKAGALVAKQKGHNESLTVEQIFSIGHSLLPSFYMKPDGLLLLSLSHDTRRRRMQDKAVSNGLDKIESRTLEYSDAVHDAYISFESALDHATVIDAEQPPEELFTQARALLFGPTHA